MVSVAWVKHMANIFMRVLNTGQALETLLYAFRNQMELGKKILTYTLKHNDGFKDYCSGTVDEVFNSDFMKDIEYQDIILLEHFSKQTNGYIHFNDNVGIDTLADMAKLMADGCHFIIPRGVKPSYVTIKNHPMFSYTVYRNELISDSIFGNKASILNNMCGKIDHKKGMYATINIR